MKIQLIAAVVFISSLAFGQDPEVPSGDIEEVVIVEAPDTLPKSRKNIISYDFFSPLFGGGRISYERLFADGHVGVSIPYMLGFKEGTIGLERVWNSGLEFKFYPLGQTRISYCFGALAEFGQARGRYYIYDNFGNYVWANDPDYFFALYGRNSAVFNITEQFSISMSLLLGFYTLDRANYTQENARAEFGLNLKF